MSSTTRHHNPLSGTSRNADLPNIDPSLLEQPSTAALFSPQRATHAPRFLVLYLSLIHI